MKECTEKEKGIIPVEAGDTYRHCDGDVYLVVKNYYFDSDQRPANDTLSLVGLATGNIWCSTGTADLSADEFTKINCCFKEIK